MIITSSKNEKKQNKKLKTEAGHQNCPRSLSMCWIFEISLNKRIAALIWVFNIWLDWIDFKLKPQYKVDIRYLEYPLSGTFSSVSSELSVTALKFVRFLEPRYLKLSLCQTIFSVPSALFRAEFHSLSRMFSLIRMLTEYIRKLWSNVYLFLFQQNNMSDARKLLENNFNYFWKKKKMNKASYLFLLLALNYYYPLFLGALNTV